MERNSNIEILRFALMCAIFIWHIIVHGLGYADIGNGSSYPYNMDWTIVSVSLLCPAVNCFMFISGWYGIKFTRRKLFTLLIITLFSSLIGAMVLYFVHGNITYRDLYVHFFPISTKCWWFMTAYMMVFLVSPFIEWGIKSIPKSDLMAIMLLMTMVLFFSIPAYCNFGSSFFGLLYIYMMGRLMQKYHLYLTFKKAFVCFFLSAAILIVIQKGVLELTGPSKYLFYVLQYNNPLIVLEGVSLFFMVYSIPPSHSKVLNGLLVPNLCIYLFSEVLLPYKDIVSLFKENTLLALGSIVGFIMGSLAIGHIVFKMAHVFVGFLPHVILDKNSTDEADK